MSTSSSTATRTQAGCWNRDTSVQICTHQRRLFPLAWDKTSTCATTFALLGLTKPALSFFISASMFQQFWSSHKQSCMIMLSQRTHRFCEVVIHHRSRDAFPAVQHQAQVSVFLNPSMLHSRNCVDRKTASSHLFSATGSLSCLTLFPRRPAAGLPRPLLASL